MLISRDKKSRIIVLMDPSRDPFSSCETNNINPLQYVFASERDMFDVKFHGSVMEQKATRFSQPQGRNWEFRHFLRGSTSGFFRPLLYFPFDSLFHQLFSTPLTPSPVTILPPLTCSDELTRVIRVVNLLDIMFLIFYVRHYICLRYTVAEASINR